MGLLYQFPISVEESDYVSTVESQNLVSLKSYGLPLIFWGYAGVISLVLMMMILGIKDPIFKMIELGGVDLYLAAFLIFFLASSILGMFSFFFYEKTLQRQGLELTIIHKLWWIPFFTKKINLSKEKSHEIAHHLDSPNMAKMMNDEQLRGFQNKGHFHLYAIGEDGKKNLIDRSSSKSDLAKIAQLLFV